MVLPTNHRVLNILIGLACLVILAGAIKYSQGLLVPILLAGFLAVLASSPLFWLQSRGVHRNLALTIVLLLSVLLLVLIGVLFFSAIEPEGGEEAINHTRSRHRRSTGRTGRHKYQ